MQAIQTVPLDIALSAWVEEAKADPVKHQERQVTEILLHAIGITESLHKALVLKGGILMSLMHGSYRHTGDVDFTAIVDPEPYAGLLKPMLNRALQRAAADLAVTDIVCAVQRFDYQPKKEGFAGFTAPALKLSIGYANKGTSDEERLVQGRSTRIVEVDISFKEKVVNTAEVVIEEPDVSIQAYRFEEVIAEKLRAVLQQIKRNRSRRQDVFDIRWLIERYHPDEETRAIIHETLLQKSESREIELAPDSLDNPDVKERSAKDWNTMELEVGGRLPDFEESFAIVRDFYRSLPWKLNSAAKP
ncbi:putative nucleotidyltransferase component of viral defense system [Rhizobium leguminosarum]|uniref:nucleotidyl transferase AbiEii/AbiGii toxin family protein n=1 Tax=Rhizobium leguminosarum TaxID=384 RepID=UPI001611600F|nr:nucleotidyl transferase AbiEii/AbiGii toxin family protein [Rhizobium leguminosarum]MBB5666341.1 putative nucleotidyltransferase component of viral defense system [Rhizobium leguminosarum]